MGGITLQALFETGKQPTDINKSRFFDLFILILI